MHLLGDQLHPTPEGYRVMAERLAPRMAEALAAWGVAGARQLPAAFRPGIVRAASREGGCGEV